MNIAYRKTFSVDIDLKVIILNSDRCVFRNKKLNTSLGIKLNDVTVANIPLGVWAKAFSYGFDILITDFENYKLIINHNTKILNNPIEDKNFIGLLKYILENKNKFI